MVLYATSAQRAGKSLGWGQSVSQNGRVQPMYTEGRTDRHTYSESPETAQANCAPTSCQIQELLYFLKQKEVISPRCLNGLRML